MKTIRKLAAVAVVIGTVATLYAIAFLIAFGTVLPVVAGTALAVAVIAETAVRW